MTVVAVSFFARLPVRLTTALGSKCCPAVVFVVGASAVVARHRGLVSSPMTFLGGSPQPSLFLAERLKTPATLMDSGLSVAVFVF